MSPTTKVPGSIITAIAAVAIAVPTAGAMPLHTSRELDSGHASVATAAAQRQDLRSPDTRDAALNPRQDLRSPDTRDAALNPRPAGKSLPGAPVFSTNAQPIPRSVSVQAPTNDDGLPWLTIVLGVAGGLAVGGSAAGITHTSRMRTRRARVVA
jgi:hypothetical protein